MTADILRRAASLMRERAEAAIAGDAHGPWRADGQLVVRDETVGPALVMIAREGVPGYPSLSYRASAEHIASWHPAVALAVADWLDACAEFIESDPGFTWDGEDHAFNIARAYLGESA